MEAREGSVALSVAEEFAGFEIAALPGADQAGQLRLLAPWREEPEERGEVPQTRDATAQAGPSFDLRAAAGALRDVLREWRAIGRELELMLPDSLDRSLLEAQVDALRAVHQRLFAAINRG
jgi:hypothetical protein